MLNLVPVSNPRSWVSPSILALPMLDLSMKARSLADGQSLGTVYVAQTVCCESVVPYAEKEWDNMEVKLSIQLSVDGRVDVDVGLSLPQLLNMCPFRLVAIILRAHLRCRSFLRIHRERCCSSRDALEEGRVQAPRLVRIKRSYTMGLALRKLMWLREYCQIFSRGEVFVTQ